MQNSVHSRKQKTVTMLTKQGMDGQSIQLFESSQVSTVRANSAPASLSGRGMNNIYLLYPIPLQIWQILATVQF